LVLGEQVQRAAVPVDEDLPKVRARGADLGRGARRRRGDAQPIRERQCGDDGSDRENQSLHVVLLPGGFAIAMRWLLSLWKDSGAALLSPSPSKPHRIRMKPVGFAPDPPVVGSSVADVQETIAPARSPEEACEFLRPRFAGLPADPDWLPAEFQAA